MNEIPQDLDWVKARAACSLVEVFQKLKADIRVDVDDRNSARPPEARYKFSVANRGNSITVYSDGYPPMKSVVFTLATDRISVADGDGEAMFEIALTLNDEGRCKPKIGGKEYEFWQVRRKALEKLFFEFYPITP